MGLVYIQSLNVNNLNTLLAYCQSINEDAMIESNYCVFEVDATQRIQLNLTLQTFQEDLADALICVEGFNHSSIMSCSLELAKRYSLGSYTHISELLLDSMNQGDRCLLEKLNDLFSTLKPELIETAKMYLLASGNAKLAAESLYLHRNTFNYRMTKFKEKSELNITDQASAFFFQLWLDFQK